MQFRFVDFINAMQIPFRWLHKCRSLDGHLLPKGIESASEETLKGPYSSRKSGITLLLAIIHRLFRHNRDPPADCPVIGIAAGRRVDHHIGAFGKIAVPDVLHPGGDGDAREVIAV